MKQKTKPKLILSKRDKIFDILNYSILTLLCLLMLYPFLYMISVSLTPADRVSDVFLYPLGFQLNAYKFIFQMPNILTGYRNTLIYTFGGLAVSMFLTICLAYVFSKKFLVGRKFLTVFVLITMYFGGGLIPSYIVNTNVLHLIDNIWVIIIPGALNTYLMIVMRTYFTSTIPIELEESAQIDGAGQYKILLYVYLPLSLPILATISLFYFVAMWNSWFGAMIYLNTESKYPIQLILRNSMERSLAMGFSNAQLAQMNEYKIDGNSLNYALTISVVLPLIVMLPFLQKFFTKGVIVGSLKG